MRVCDGCGCARAQVSLEFLVLVAAFLAFLAAWMPVISRINADAGKGIAEMQARETASGLAAALDDVCMLGEGNVRMVDVKLAGPADVEGRGKRVFVVGKGYAVAADMLCSSGPDFRLHVDGNARIRVYAQEGGVKVELINY
ncbi:Uncharacterised protein [Candidatus Burarchaeum australiense]|nr:Uncharacterised protein [Candidatus Burarchaeum australiense]